MASLGFYVFTGPVLAKTIAGIFVEFLGIFIAIYAIYIIKLRNINISPLVKEGGQLVTTGPYRYIRHPMYIAQIIAVLPLLIENFSWPRLIVLIILITTLSLKIDFEEKQLVDNFPEYSAYKKKTYKMIPYIY